MPQIKLKKELTRGEKVLPEGTVYQVSWNKYRELLEEGYCTKHKDDKKVKKVNKEQMQFDTKKVE